MKKTIIILAMVIINAISSYSYAQNIMTNSVKGTVSIGDDASLWFFFSDLARAFNVRICSENKKRFYNRSEKSIKYFGETSISPYKQPMIFTDATFEHAFETVMAGTTNHVWRYDSSNDTIYIYPATNAISLRNIGPISITNATLQNIFYDNDILGLKSLDMLYSINQFDNTYWNDIKITLEFENALLYQVLDAIGSQLPNGELWQIRESQSVLGNRYTLHFYGRKENIPRRIKQIIK